MQSNNTRQLAFLPKQQSTRKMAPKEQLESLKELDNVSNTHHHHHDDAVGSKINSNNSSINISGHLSGLTTTTATTSTTTTTSTSLPPSTRDIKKLLRKIRDSKVAQEVEDAMTLLAAMMMMDTDNDENNNEDNSNSNERFAVGASTTTVQTKTFMLFSSLDGVGTILMALKDWYISSERVSAVAVPLLLKLSVLGNGESIRLFVANVGLPTLLATAKAHEMNGSVVCGVIGILSVLCCDDKKNNSNNNNSDAEEDDHDEDDLIKEEIASDDCIDLCVHAMKTWENESFVQSCCCLYLSNILVASNPATIKVRLSEKNVGALILAALERYRHNHDQKEKIVYRRAFRAMTLYIAE